MSNKFEKISEGLAGAVKDVKAGFKGLSGVFMHLMEEHGKVGALINRVAESDELAVRAEHYPAIRKALLAHEKGEVQVVYAALAELPEGHAIAAAHAREAGELQAAIAAVDALSFENERWAARFRHLAGLVADHVAHEESDFFPKAQQALGEERAKRMLPEFEAAKKAS